MSDSPHSQPALTFRSGAYIVHCHTSMAGSRTPSTFSPPNSYLSLLRHPHCAQPRPPRSRLSTPAGSSHAFSSSTRTCPQMKFPTFDNSPRRASSLLYGKSRQGVSERMEARWMRHKMRCGGARGWCIGQLLGVGRRRICCKTPRICLLKSSEWAI